MNNLNVESVVFAIGGLAAAAYFLLVPLKETWMPLDLETDPFSATYVDTSSIRWSGEKVMFYTKVINKNGSPFSINYLMPDQQAPAGIRFSWMLDCQQKRLSFIERFIFAIEGKYAALPHNPNGIMSAPIVLDGKGRDHFKFLSICDSQRPTFNPFRYGFMWDIISPHRDENVISLMDWVENQRSGKGAAVWGDGSRYVGDFSKGNRSGKGVFTFPNGDQYDGDFVNNVQTGKGVYKWTSGHRYEGDFDEQGTQTGKGIYIWPNGDRFEGTFDNGALMNGIFTFTNGEQKLYQNGRPM